jgi:DNA-binding NarL/FixJ family response regulator
MKILIADDSELILERLQSILAEIERVELVASLNNGIDALAAMKSLNPDLAIIDIRMPGISGLQILGDIRRENKSVVVILLTLHSQGYIKQMAGQLGADYFFNKADDFEQMVQLVSELSQKTSKNINNYK